MNTHRAASVLVALALMVGAGWGGAPDSIKQDRVIRILGFDPSKIDLNKAEKLIARKAALSNLEIYLENMKQFKQDKDSVSAMAITTMLVMSYVEDVPVESLFTQKSTIPQKAK